MTITPTSAFPGLPLAAPGEDATGSGEGTATAGDFFAVILEALGIGAGSPAGVQAAAAQAGAAQAAVSQTDATAGVTPLAAAQGAPEQVAAALAETPAAGTPLAAPAVAPGNGTPLAAPAVAPGTTPGTAPGTTAVATPAGPAPAVPGAVAAPLAGPAATVPVAPATVAPQTTATPAPSGPAAPAASQTPTPVPPDVISDVALVAQQGASTSQAGAAPARDATLVPPPSRATATTVSVTSPKPTEAVAAGPTPAAGDTGRTSAESHGHHAGSAAPDATPAPPLPATAAVTASAATGAAASGDAAPGTVAASVRAQVFSEVTNLVSRGDGVHRVTMTLAPESLGEVRVVMTMRAGVVRVHLTASDGDAKAALAHGSPELARLLETVGASDTRIVVRDPQESASMNGQPSQFAAGSDRHPHEHAGTRAHHPATDGTNDTTPLTGAGADLPRSIEPAADTRTPGVDVTV